MNGGHPAVGSPVGSALIYWKFDEGFGNTAHNSGSTGSALDGTLNNSPVWKNEGKLGKALNFNGSTQSVTATLSSDPGYGNTLTAWIYPVTSAASKTIITATKLITDSSSRPNYGSCVGSALPLNQWTHIVAVSDGSGSCTIYQNGVQTATGTTGVTFGTAVNVGASSFSGLIDEVKLYNYPLNAQEVKVEYNQSKAAVWGALSTNPDGRTASNSAARAYCPPGNSESNCAGTGVLNPAPVAEWKFDERTGTIANDTSGNANTGTLTGGPQWTTGKIGSALQFNGINNYISTANSPNFGTGDFTFSAWIKFSQAQQNKDIVGYFSGTITYTLLVDPDSEGTNSLGLYFRDSNGIQTYTASHLKYGSGYNDNKWHLVTGVRSGGTSYLYIDGARVNSRAVAFTGNFNGGAPYIGAVNNAGSPSNYFKGAIDDVRVYNYARTQAQVAWDYNRGKPVAWWKFDECAGTTAHDASGKGNNGTITIGATGTQTSSGTCNSGGSSEAWYNGTTGKFNSALNFDGTDDYVDVANATSLNFGTNNFSVSMWLKYPSQTGGVNNYSMIYGKNNAVFPFVGIDIFADSDCTTWGGIGNICFRVDSNNALGSSASNLNDNSWRFFTFIREGTTLKIYINGILDNSGSISNINVDNSQILRIGANSTVGTSQNFTGTMDDVRVYNYALTPAQIRTVYNEDSAIRFGP